MPKVLTEIKSLARVHTEASIRTLAAIMKQKKSPPAARVAAATALMDRGWGKPAQAIVGDEEGGPLQLIHRIERVIVGQSND